jgi:hypothetical protein
MSNRLWGHRPQAVQLGSVFLWLLPYLVIWGGTAGLVGTLDLRASCIGFCAVYAGFQTYTMLLGAALLSVLVASAELFLGRAH